MKIKQIILFLLFGFYVNYGLFSQTSITKTAYNAGIPATTANPGDILQYVIEIDNSAGIAPNDTVKLTDDMSTNQSYVANSLIANAWAPGNNATAWFNASNQATATWNNISLAPQTDMSPLLGTGSYLGTMVAPQIMNSLSSSTGSGDGYFPLSYIAPNGHVIAFSVNHHSSNPNIVECWDLSTGMACSTGITYSGLFTTSSYCGPVKVGNKAYFTQSQNVAGTYIIGLGCLDLSDNTPKKCTTPWIGTGHSGTPSTVPFKVEDKVCQAYTNNTSTSDLGLSYLFCIKADSTIAIPSYPILLPTTQNASYSNGITKSEYVKNNKFFFNFYASEDTDYDGYADMSVYNGTSCIDITNPSSLLDCDGTPIIKTFPYYIRVALPLLNNVGSIIGSCNLDAAYTVRCYDLNSNSIAYPPNYNLFIQSIGGAADQNYLLDTIKSRIYVSTRGGGIACYDFVSQANCGSIVHANDTYGIGFIEGTNCIMGYGDPGMLDFYSLGTNSISGGCNSTLSAFTKTWNISNPSLLYCDASPNNILWNNVSLSNLPTTHSSSLIEIFDENNILLQSFPIASNVQTANFPSSGLLNDLIPYATYQTLKIRLTLTNSTGTTEVVRVVLNHSNGTKHPQICYNAVVNDCSSALSNTATIVDGGIASTSATTNPITCIILPITLSSFTAEKELDNSILSWETASELNASHFEIERAVEPNLFQKTGNVDAKGAGLYVYEDNSPSQGLNLYRLKMVDLDGSFAYSSVIELNFENTLQASLFPNPAQNRVSLSFFEDELNTDIFVSNALGEVIYKNSLNPSTEMQNITLSLQGWAKGLYFVHLENKKHQVVLKLAVE